MADPIGIEIRNLYKIFGADPQARVEAVRAGMSKAELQARKTIVFITHDLPEASIATRASIVCQLQALRVHSPEGRAIGVIPFQTAIDACSRSAEARP